MTAGVVDIEIFIVSVILARLAILVPRAFEGNLADTVTLPYWGGICKDKIYRIDANIIMAILLIYRDLLIAMRIAWFFPDSIRQNFSLASC
jgi:hypothetical protein